MCSVCANLGINIHLNGGVIDPTPVEFSLDPYAGGTFRDLPILSLDGVVGQIATGRTVHASNGIVTYSFYEGGPLNGLYNNPNYSFGDAYAGLSPFTAAQREAARDAIQFWDDLIPLTFREKNGHGADIRFANSVDPAQAYAYYPAKQGYKFQSDVFVADPEVNWSNAWFTPGGYGNTTLIHELGHTLGLSHPGAYNYDPALDLTYDNYAEYAQDSEQYTLMSYWTGDETGNRVIQWNTFQYSSAQTPMLHDILAIQSQYGADPTTRAGNTVYGFNSNAGNDVFDFNLNPYPYLSIYDAGGNDTIDLSGFNVGQFLDLHAGSFSSIGAGAPTAATANAARAELFALAGAGTPAPLTQTQINNSVNGVRVANAEEIALDTGVADIYATEYSNFSIAYGVTIENAIGGSARDLLWGNQVANVLEGRGGNDVLNGFEGADTLDGGIGADTLSGGGGSDTFRFSNLEAAGQFDTVSDFAAGDRIDLRLIDANSTRGGDQAFAFIGSGAFSGVAGQLRYSGGQILGDVNGDGVADFTVVIANNAALNAGDFFL